MRISLTAVLILLTLFFPLNSRGEETDIFQTVAPPQQNYHGIRLKTNTLPWLLTVPNMGGEYLLNDKWSVALDVMYCPWKLSQKFAVKTVAILPEGRWWLKNNKKGSFFNIHLNIAWYNVRAGSNRYQDAGRPVLGGGIGYGYRLEFSRRWGLEFEVGAGVMNTRFDRFYNIANGALKDSGVSTYWGIDRAGISVSYQFGDL